MMPAELGAGVRLTSDPGTQFGQNILDYLVHSEVSAPPGWAVTKILLNFRRRDYGPEQMPYGLTSANAPLCVARKIRVPPALAASKSKYCWLASWTRLTR